MSDDLVTQKKRWATALCKAVDQLEIEQLLKSQIHQQILDDFFVNIHSFEKFSRSEFLNQFWKNYEVLNYSEISSIDTILSNFTFQSGINSFEDFKSYFFDFANSLIPQFGLKAKIALPIFDKVFTQFDQVEIDESLFNARNHELKNPYEFDIKCISTAPVVTQFTFAIYTLNLKELAHKKGNYWLDLKQSVNNEVSFFDEFIAYCAFKQAYYLASHSFGIHTKYESNKLQEDSFRQFQLAISDRVDFHSNQESSYKSYVMSLFNSLESLDEQAINSINEQTLHLLTAGNANSTLLSSYEQNLKAFSTWLLLNKTSFTSIISKHYPDCIPISLDRITPSQSIKKSRQRKPCPNYFTFQGRGGGNHEDILKDILSTLKRKNYLAEDFKYPSFKKLFLLPDDNPNKWDKVPIPVKWSGSLVDLASFIAAIKKTMLIPNSNDNWDITIKLFSIKDINLSNKNLSSNVNFKSYIYQSIIKQFSSTNS